MTTDIRDCPPGTVPPWVLRFAYDGEEWLVLSDYNAAARVHVCGGVFLKGLAVELCQSFVQPNPRCGCPGTFLVPPKPLRWHGDSLAAAEAAFERIEQEWRAAKEAAR